MLGDLDAELFFLRGHELRIILNLGVRQGFLLSISSFLIPHQLLKERLEFADHVLLLLHCVLIQGSLLVLFCESAQFGRLLLEGHL